MNPNQGGERNSAWKGDKASYSALHYRVRKERGTPSLCEQCGTTTAKRFEWALKHDGDIKNTQDYIRMCRSCHWKYDERRVGKEFSTHG